MIVGVVKENLPGERRVALVPASVPRLVKAGCEVFVERGAGDAAGFSDALYLEKGAKIVSSRAEAFAADVLVQVRAYGANLTHGAADLGMIHPGLAIVGMCDPLGEPAAVAKIAATGATLLALELMPRITRAQSMDVLSSMATIAGYRAVLKAASELPKLMPMLTTAAGTISPARAFVIGAGVAGLQAIATAKRMGAQLQAYDLRPACREQCESLGAKFVELPLEAAGAEDKGGYAKAMDEAFYARQRELMASIVAQSDVVITTALIPGKPSPLLVTANAVAGMQPGSVIIDLAAERGGNCELTKADQRVVQHGVTILGPTNLASEAPLDASRMLSNNITNFLLHLIQDGKLNLNVDDEITRETLATTGGQVVHEKLKAASAAK